MQEIDPLELIIDRLMGMGYTLEQIDEMRLADGLELIIMDNELKDIDDGS